MREEKIAWDAVTCVQNENLLRDFSGNSFADLDESTWTSVAHEEMLLRTRAFTTTQSRAERSEVDWALQCIR